MITCQRAAECTSQELAESLPAGVRFALGFHRFLCPPCRRFRTQVAEVERAVEHFLTDGEGSGEGLSDDARRRIADALANDTSG